MDCVSNHAHVGGELSNTLVADGVGGVGEVTGAFHGVHDVLANRTRHVVIGIVAVILAVSGSEASKRAEGAIALLGILAVCVDVLCCGKVIAAIRAGSGLDVTEILHQRSVVVDVRGVGVSCVCNDNCSGFSFSFIRICSSKATGEGRAEKNQGHHHSVLFCAIFGYHVYHFRSP